MLIQRLLARIGVRVYRLMPGVSRTVCVDVGPIHATFYERECAMHGAVNVFVPRVGYVCFKPPTKSFGVWWPWYFYVSPDATPNRATFMLGSRRRGLGW